MTKETLRALREEHALTQRAMGALLGYHANYIYRLESGKAPLTRRVGRLVEALLVQRKRARPPRGQERAPAQREERDLGHP
jgi:transcriptional regulator with XRE-family HTH domain